MTSSLVEPAFDLGRVGATPDRCVAAAPETCPAGQSRTNHDTPARPSLHVAHRSDGSSRGELFDRLITSYGRMIAEAVRRVAGRTAPGDLEDIQQDVMLALWKRLASESTIDHPSSYLYTMAIREAVRATRLRCRRQETPLDEGRVTEPAAEADVETTLVREQAAARLQRVLQTLPLDRSRAVRGHLAGLSVEELMHLYGWTYQRARNLLARGIGDVKTRMVALARP